MKNQIRPEWQTKAENDIILTYMAIVKNVQIKEEFVRLGQFLKICDLISSGGEAKIFLKENEIFVNGVVINFQIILTYLPVSLLYIVSMALGYLGLRYIELSISSPICNSSGAIVAVLTLMTVGIGEVGVLYLIAYPLLSYLPKIKDVREFMTRFNQK